MRKLPGLLPCLASSCAVTALLLAVGGAPGAEAPAPTVAVKPVESSRAPDATERSAMLEILKAEAAPERAAWLSYAAGNAESKALADALVAVFRDAGWTVQSSALGGMVLKPGVSILLAEEAPPTWTESALRALQASGLDVKSATGYRAYFDEKKAENPAWPGVPLAKDAAFVIVVGPAPKG